MTSTEYPSAVLIRTCTAMYKASCSQLLTLHSSEPQRRKMTSNSNIIHIDECWNAKAVAHGSLRWWLSESTHYHVKGTMTLYKSATGTFRLHYSGMEVDKNGVEIDSSRPIIEGTIQLHSFFTIQAHKYRSTNAKVRAILLTFKKYTCLVQKIQLTIPIDDHEPEAVKMMVSELESAPGATKITKSKASKH